MKKLCSSIGSVALLSLLMSKASAADVFKLDSDGYIRDWVMLAPIVLPEEGDCADLILKEQGNWQGAMRFLDKAGVPLKKLKIKLSP